jgi:drug/metabolite transporter (DMT)-like permease
MKYVLAVLAILLGGAAIVYGEGDDSPGLQLLGALLVIAAIVLVVRKVRRGQGRSSGLR